MPTTSKKVYLAGDLLYSFVDRNDEKHNQSTAFFRYFALEKYHLFTDSYTLFDIYNRINDDMGLSVAKDFLRTITSSNITLLYPDESDMKAVYKIYLSDRISDMTLRQAIMAVLADRRGIPQIATFQYMQTMFGLTVFYIPI
ncbi:hypothetical protein ACFL1A_01675 [Patescibacteria group bacterium]